MISVSDALDILKAHALEPGGETCALEDALGRRLAAPIIAQVTQPPAAVSAMDGYAVRLADVRKAGAALEVTGEIAAGSVPAHPLTPGTAMRIFTGASLPEGADHVLIQEEAERAGETITVTTPQEGPRHVRAAGLDFSRGETLVAARVRLGAAEIAVAAAANTAQVEVTRRPRVAVLTSGDELRPPGSALRPGEIVNANSLALAALVRGWGGAPQLLDIAADSVAAIREQIEAAADADLIVTIGGASVGDHDHMKPAFREAGADILFEKIAVRPGKPTWFARLGGRRVLGLPGNPASAYVCAQLFLRPLLGETTGGEVTARLAHDLDANGPRETYLRAVVSEGAREREVEALPNQDSSLLTPFLKANALIRRAPGAPDARTGETVTCVRLGA